MPHDLDECCTSTPHAQHKCAQHGNAQQGHAQHRVRTARARAAGTRNAIVLLWAAVTSFRGTACVSHPSQDAAAARCSPPSAHASNRQAHFCGAGRPARMPTRPRAVVGRRGPAIPVVFVLAGHKGARDAATPRRAPLSAHATNHPAHTRRLGRPAHAPARPPASAGRRSPKRHVGASAETGCTRNAAAGSRVPPEATGAPGQASRLGLCEAHTRPRPPPARGQELPARRRGASIRPPFWLRLLKIF